jgi:hypothetical protein
MAIDVDVAASGRAEADAPTAVGRAARDHCIVGCIETSGQSNTHGCVGGHELVLPAVLLLTLSRGRRPAPFLGQGPGFDSGDLAALSTFDDFVAALRRQLAHQVEVLVKAAAGKDRAYIDLLPAPYVSALMDGCIAAARDVTAGGAKYDFTSVDVRGLATLVDSLLAVKTFVYDRRQVGLDELARICERDFAGHEALRQRLIHEPPKYGTGGAEGIDTARRVLEWLHGEVSPRRNPRGGRFRMCYYSYGNHVIDGFLLGATPDGRRHGEPISNGVSPSNLIDPAAGPTGPLRTVAGLPPRLISSGVSLNMRFFPDFIATPNGRDAFAAMLRTYFALGGMHLQPNVISTETLRGGVPGADPPSGRPDEGGRRAGARGVDGRGLLRRDGRRRDLLGRRAAGAGRVPVRGGGRAAPRGNPRRGGDVGPLPAPAGRSPRPRSRLRAVGREARRREEAARDNRERHGGGAREPATAAGRLGAGRAADHSRAGLQRLRGRRRGDRAMDRRRREDPAGAAARVPPARRSQAGAVQQAVPLARRGRHASLPAGGGAEHPRARGHPGGDRLRTRPGAGVPAAGLSSSACRTRASARSPARDPP